ncbi:MAG: hypothetical protein ACHBNF_05855 [Chromatiales bacterium]
MLSPILIDLPPLAFLFAFVGAIIAGAIVASGNILYAALFGGALIGLIIAGSPVLLLWVTIITSLVLAGTARLYLPGLQNIRWLVPVAVLGLTAHAFFSQLAIPKIQRGRPIPAILWWALAFFCITLLSTLGNMPSGAQMLRGYKGYFQVWGLLIALAYIPWPAVLINKLPRALLGIALLQVPFALHQYFVVVPSRVTQGIVPVDIVAGTFGAELEGGGLNALLSAFQFMVVAGLIALWRRDRLSGTRALTLSAVLLVPLLINEAKVSLVYGIIVFLVLYRNEIVRPLRFLRQGLVFTVVFGIFLMAYTMNAPSDKVQSWTDLIMFTYGYNVSTKENQEGELTRWGELEFWAQKHGVKNLPHTLLGYGLGVSRVSDGGVMESLIPTDRSSAGKVGSINPALGIGNTAVAALLWETGIIGLLCIFALFWSAYRLAFHLERRYAQDPWQSAIFRAGQAAIAVFFVSLGHKNLLVFEVGFQTVLMLLFGYLVYWHRRHE